MKKSHNTYKVVDTVELIVKMRIQQGKTYLDILTYLREEMGYEQMNAYKMVRMAKEEISTQSLILFGEDLKEDIERFEQLYTDALIADNKKEARECLKEIAKLKGHYVERLQMSGEITYVAKF